MNGVGDQDTLVYVCTNEPCDPLATLVQESPVFQSHELVWVTFNLVRYSFAGLDDGGGHGTVRAWGVTPFSVINKTNKNQQRG